MRSIKQAARRHFEHGAVLRYRTFFLLSWDLKGWMQRLRNRFSLADRRRRRALRAQRELSINLGTGGRGLEGWVNTDLIRHADTTITVDLCRPLPFSSGSACRIFAEHVFEHLDLFRDGLPLLRECRRVLRSGGLLRLVVPDFRRFCEAYVSDDPAQWAALGLAEWPEDMPTRACMLAHVHQQDGEHYMGFDFATLEWALRQAGFDRVVQCAFGVGADPALTIDRPEHQPYSLYVEAQVP